MRDRFLLTLICLALLFVSSAPAAGASRLVPVSTPNELRTALSTALEGDVIELAPGDYRMSDLSGYTQYYEIENPWKRFTIRSATPGAAVIDGEGASRLLWLEGTSPEAAGWVTFEGLVFANGHSSSYDAGGLRIYGARATFIDCVFQNNSATLGPTPGASAGAMLITRGALVQFIRCRWSDNTTDTHGGAMLVGQGAEVEIHDSQFIDNRNNLPGHADNGLGGAIHLYNSVNGVTTKIRISDTRFEGNQAGFVGGAIMAKGDFATAANPLGSPTSVVIANCTFSQNIALNDVAVNPDGATEGGAVMAENNVSLEVFNSRFFGNSAGFGGAISSYRAAIHVDSSVLRNNEAFGRVDTGASGGGGAIAVHSSDGCDDASNYPNAYLSVSNTHFENCSSQTGGCVFASGDLNRDGSDVSGCQMGTLSDNRMSVILDQVVFAGCSVDDVVGDNGIGGGLYGVLIDLTWKDSMVVDSYAAGTDPEDTLSASKGLGGAAALFRECRLDLTGSVFGDNWADHAGGALYLIGSEIAGFSDNTFVANGVSPGVDEPVNQSRGAVLFIGPLRSRFLDATGSVTNSVFSDNEGMPILESDALASDPCGCGNRVTYEGNRFFSTSFDDDVYRNTVVSGARTAEELNVLMVDRGDGDTTKKSQLETNEDEMEPIPVARIRLAPGAVLANNATGGAPSLTQSMLSWVWNGGCAELDEIELDSETESSGFFSAASGIHGLSVWGGGDCAGSADLLAEDVVLSGPDPVASFLASPNLITTGENSAVSWDLVSGDLITGVISHGVMDEVTAPSGSVQVTPANTVHYNLTLVTRQGGVVHSAPVWVDEEPPFLFVDGFETGNVSLWSSSVP